MYLLLINFGRCVLQGFMFEERWGEVHDERSHLVQPRARVEYRGCRITQINGDQGIKYWLALYVQKLGRELAVKCESRQAASLISSYQYRRENSYFH